MEYISKGKEVKAIYSKGLEVQKKYSFGQVYYEKAAAFDFATDSWAKIGAVPNPELVYNVGDTKTFALTTGEQITSTILGFYHDDLTAGGKAPITIGMENLLTTRYPMNATDTNAGGWNGCAMRANTMASLFLQLPADLQAVIKQVNKKASAGSQSTNITTSADKLWLFSEVEIDNTTTAVYVNEGVQYEYWKTIKDGTVNANRIKYLSNGGGSANSWWLRSPNTSGSTAFRRVGSTGVVSSYVASGACGVSFGFCI